MTPLATSIPGSSNNGYVAAAYIVFFAIVLVYVAIMALRLTRVERGLRELDARAEQSRQGETRQDETPQDRVAPDAPPSQREHETV